MNTKQSDKQLLECPCLGTVKEHMPFNNEEHPDQGIKLAFLCNLWAWSKLYIPLGSSSIVDFVD